MKIIKPDDMAIVHRALRLQGQDRLCVGLVALFPLLPLGAPAPAALLPETELWQRLPQAPGAPAVLDEGYPKPQAEFLLYGEACAPGGTAVTELAVRARVGTLDKALIVRGDRHWGALGTASSPVPFTRMPIVPATAFGGPGDPAHLLGKSAPALPNVEDPRHPLVFKDDRSVAAGFWGVDSSAPQRQRHLGAVGTPWLQKTWPHLPEDTADAFFQSAPADQRMAGGAGAAGGGFRGDETIALTHLHPTQARIESALPALRARCFAQRRQGADGAHGVFEEIRTHAETVWLMPGLGLGAVLYRGTLAVSDEEARDVACIVTGWEPMSDTPWPEAHYREQMQPVSGGAKVAQAAQPVANAAATLATVATAPTAASASPALGVVAGAAAAAGAAVVAQSAVNAAVKAAVTAAVALPVNAATDPLPGANPTSAERVATAAEQAVANMPATDPELAQIERMTADMEAQTQRLLAEHGIPRSQIDAMMQPLPQPEVSLAEIEGFTHKLQAEHAALLADNGLTQADVDAFIQSRQVELPGEVSLADIEAHTQAMREQTQQLMRDNGIDHDDVADFLASRGASQEAVSLMRQFPSLVALSAGAVAAPLHAALPAPAPAAGEAGAEKTADPAAAAPAAPAPAAPPVDVAAAAAPPPPAPHPPTTREEVIAWHAEARSFAGLGLAGLDLSDLDLAGADFSGGTLEHTRFDRSRLAGTRFDRAILQGASLEGIDGTQASFEAARAAGSRFANATLTGATLNAADFSTGDFTGANLQGAHCTRTDFSDACMAGLRGAKLQAVQADFSRCNLGAASLQGATLTAARFDQARIEGASLATVQAERSEWYEAQARQADFAGADLRGARAGAGTVFAGANLRGANMEGAAWADGVDLQGAALQGARIERADFSGAQAVHLVMSGASARGVNFSRAALQGADATGADLMGASLRHAQLAGTRFAGANLHGSDCYGSTIAQAHVAGALTTATLMQIAGRPEAVKA